MPFGISYAQFVVVTIVSPLKILPNRSIFALN